MNDYTPSLDILSAYYCVDRSIRSDQTRKANAAKRQIEFDRAIAKIKAEAWLAGLRAGSKFGDDVRNGARDALPANPYRSTDE